MAEIKDSDVSVLSSDKKMKVGTVLELMNQMK